jgi:serine protease
MKTLPILALLFGLCAHGAFAERTPPRAAALQPSAGEVIVAFKSGATTTRMHALAARSDALAVRSVLAQRAGTLGSRIGRTLEAGAAVGERTQVVRAAGVDAATLAAQLAADPDVEFAVPNGRMRRLAAPNDPLYAAGPPVNLAQQTGGPDVGQWYLHAPNTTIVSAIDIESAWLQSTGNANVVVAVIDTGVRRDHPDLAGHMLQGYDFISDTANANDSDGRDADSSDPGDWVSQADINSGSLTPFGCTAADITPSSWHGTSTASLIGAATNNGIGMAGAAPGVSVLPLRVLGKCGGSDADIQAAMLWAAGIHVPGVPDNAQPAKVLNLSLGATGACSASYQSVVNQVLAKGAVIVVAAGNSTGHAVGTPANCVGVLGVAGLRHAGSKVGFSDLGPQIALSAPAGNCVNIGASEPCLYPIVAASNSGTQSPGASTYTDSFDASLGTSFSAPLVAATAALMFSAQPALTPAGVRAALRASARAFPSSGIADDPNTGPIVACHAPNGVDQLQCYCTSTTCGAAGHSIASYLWTLVDGGGIVTTANGASTATATLTPTAAGSFTVRLEVADETGVAVAAQQTVTVAAAPPSAAPVASGGGGAMSWAWLVALLIATLALPRKPLSRPS